ncbi:MAG: hypothetical protein M2R45_02872 [Verrucomicrobia subdivision 3 bacterium]|nr:hypothetical protein [Limisphaerales bacterium]MCS1414724.1 hypothetical protein [Limisphaerales bacterium]
MPQEPNELPSRPRFQVMDLRVLVRAWMGVAYALFDRLQSAVERDQFWRDKK